MDAAEALALTERMHARLVARRPQIEKSENYYIGKQPLAYATREWRRKAGSRYDGFADNWCRPVVDAEAERIRHIGLSIDGNDRGARELWRHWQRNEMEMQSSQGWLSSLVASRSFVTVWGDSDDQPALEWQHAGVVEIEYDPAHPRKKVAALKSWLDDKYEYATLYTATEVFKWRREAKQANQDGRSQQRQLRTRLKLSATSKSWEPLEVGNETWPLANPLGAVPVVEMPNRPLLAADPVSEIAGVMSMQDAINILWAYLFLGADYASLPARVVMGQGPPKMPILDASGQKIGERPVSMDDLQEKRLLYLTSQDAKIGQYDAAKLDVFTEVIEAAVGHIAAQTRTPPTYLVTRTGMSNVNGSGIKASEIGLVNKVREFHTFINPALRELYRLVALAGGQDALAEQARYASIAWADAEIRSDAEMADSLLKKRSIGYPFEHLLELDGKSPTEIDRIMGMRRDEAFDPQVAAALRSFDQQAAIEAEVVNDDPAGNV